ncbi:hypothetical protein Tco_1109249 [Tanacetum coccineum]
MDVSPPNLPWASCKSATAMASPKIVTSSPSSFDGIRRISDAVSTHYPDMMLLLSITYVFKKVVKKVVEDGGVMMEKKETIELQPQKKGTKLQEFMTI